MAAFWSPFFHYVLKRIWVIHGKADEKDIRVWVGEGSQSVVIFLASCVSKNRQCEISNHPDFPKICKCRNYDKSTLYFKLRLLLQ